MRTIAFTMLMLLPALLAAQPRELPPEGATISDEIRFPLGVQALGTEREGASGGVEYNKYYSRRLHDFRHQTLFGEAVALPTSSFHVAIRYQPDPDLGVRNTGYSGEIGAVKMLGDVALGGWARMVRADIDETREQVDDFEFGPQISLWPGNRLYMNDRILYRRIGAYTDRELGISYSTEDFLQIRHHLTYIVGEDWDFTYAHDLSMRVGIHQNYHTNNLTMHNYFLFSTTPLFSFGPVAGVSLDYIVGSRASVLTIPFGARIEYFFSSLSLLQGDISYEAPTMPGSKPGQVRIDGSFSYRF